MEQQSAKIHFKDQWYNVESGDLLSTEYSTQTVYCDTKDDLDMAVQRLVESRRGSNVYEGIRQVTEVLSIDGAISPIKYKLTKEEMFDFMLKNWVSISPDGGIWTKTDGTKVRNKYTVSINDTRMCGMDLEEAIQYYHDNLRKR